MVDSSSARAWVSSGEGAEKEEEARERMRR